MWPRLGHTRSTMNGVASPGAGAATAMARSSRLAELMAGMELAADVERTHWANPAMEETMLCRGGAGGEARRAGDGPTAGGVAREGRDLATREDESGEKIRTNRYVCNQWQ